MNKPKRPFAVKVRIVERGRVVAVTLNIAATSLKAAEETAVSLLSLYHTVVSVKAEPQAVDDGIVDLYKRAGFAR